MARFIRHAVSKLFQPQIIVPKGAEVKYDDLTSKSQKLLLDLGLIRSANNGFFYILPLGERVVNKLTCIVNEEMEKINAQKLILPSLVSAHLWKVSGRLDDNQVTNELFTLKDRHEKTFVLSPTHEEAVTDLLSSFNMLSHRDLPLRLYQITSKFRDEMKPRFGLLRSKEFLMKDLYTFDKDLEEAKKTYEAVTDAYKIILDRIGVKYVRVAGLTGMMGGSSSHEFHFPSEVGEDRIVICETCGSGNNVEACPNSQQTEEETNTGKCLACGSKSLSFVQGIEVGHTFLLGTRYTIPLKAYFTQNNGKPVPLQMGCYGLGITRIFAAVVECLSETAEIKWPLVLAPFKVCIIPPKGGSKESASGDGLLKDLCHFLHSSSLLSDDIIVDDRTDLTIGKRLRDALRVGYPFAVVLGKYTMEPIPLLEIHNFTSGHKVLLPLSEAIQYIVREAKLDCNAGLSGANRTEDECATRL